MWMAPNCISHHNMVLPLVTGKLLQGVPAIHNFRIHNLKKFVVSFGAKIHNCKMRVRVKSCFSGWSECNLYQDFWPKINMLKGEINVLIVDQQKGL